MGKVNKATMSETFKFLNINFNSLDITGTISTIEKLVENRTPAMFFSLSAELITMAQKNERLRNIYTQSKIVTIDSYVVYYLTKLFGNKISEPVSASRVMFNMLPVAEKKNYRIFLLGASEEVISKVVENLGNTYKNINIVGYSNGYFNKNNDTEIINKITQSRPDILFVGMSSPLKEYFIYSHLADMNVPISIGVGGIFDIIAGECKLAPHWVSKIGLEWFYRFLQEPRRMWKRYLITNSKFVILLFKELFKSKNH